MTTQIPSTERALSAIAAGDMRTVALYLRSVAVPGMKCDLQVLIELAAHLEAPHGRVGRPVDSLEKLIADAEIFHAIETARRARADSDRSTMTKACIGDVADALDISESAVRQVITRQKSRTENDKVDIRAVLQREADEPVRALAVAEIAPEADEHIGVGEQRPKVHFP